MARYFVTGTDTDVGKTVASALLVAALDAHYWKPIQAGTVPCTDSQSIAALTASSRILPEQVVLKAPMSPHAAAELEGRSLYASQFDLPTEDPLIVEGAGGILVPINEQETMLDLMVQFALPVILVARSGLGTLNHTFLSLRALRERGLEVEGVILNGPHHTSNRDTIEKIGEVRILGEIPPLHPLNRDTLLTCYEERFEWKPRQPHGTPLLK